MNNNLAAETYDLLVLGSGEAGKYLAWTLAKQGQRVAVVERSYVGGSCPNIACLPSKNVIHSAKVASYFARGAEFGYANRDTSINLSVVRERKRAMVAELVEIHRANYRASGAELIMGTGRFVAPGTIEVALNGGGTRVVCGTKVVISTGTRAAIDDIPGLRAANPLTHIEALELDVLPARVLVVGGGYVGLEFAQALRRFGSHVTLIERNQRLLHREDEDVSEMLEKVFHAEGVEIITGAQITHVEGKSGAVVRVHATKDGAKIVFEGSHLLVATGRIPNTNGIGLDVAGVETTGGGYVKVNERLETTVAAVWAVGECAGSPQFTHVAYDDFRILRDNFAGGHRVTTSRQVPFCLFTDPEFARVGLSETQAKAQGLPYRFAKIPMSAVLRARTLGETTGFMKALVAMDSDQILGFSAVGVGTGETLASIQVAMSAGLPFTVLRDAIFTHPTLSEGLGPLFSAIPSRG